jgi:hypothetical protein
MAKPPGKPARASWMVAARCSKTGARPDSLPASRRPPARAPCGRALLVAGARIPTIRTAQVSSALTLTNGFHGCRCPRAAPARSWQRDRRCRGREWEQAARYVRSAMQGGFGKCRRNRTGDRKIGQPSDRYRSEIGQGADRFESAKSGRFPGLPGGMARARPDRAADSFPDKLC